MIKKNLINFDRPHVKAYLYDWSDWAVKFRTEDHPPYQQN